MRRALLTAVLLSLCQPVRATAQEWNGAAVRALVARAIARRAQAGSDTTLRDYRARAQGFVFFLGQWGEVLAEPPRLVKSDELVLEVYWRAPGLSKQQIVGWRDRTDLPTDIQYHRDHLGIVQSNFGNRIRLGHGEEVRDVPHPLAPNGPALYDYALVDSLTIRLPQRAVRVSEVRVRPKQFAAPRVVGSLLIDVATAELVVFRFSFTRQAYLDQTLEDISIVLENAMWGGRYWLPRRQEIEIRRRTAWLDLPARGIIRGRWEIGDYAFNLGLADSLFRGPEIVAAPQPALDSFPWTMPLSVAIRQAAGPVTQLDFEEVRAEIEAVAGPHMISRLATARPGVNGISDLLHFNRVEGLAVGAGWLLRPGGAASSVRLWASYGFSDRRPKGRLVVRHERRGGTFELALAREAADVGSEPVIAPALNSVLAQELGRDFGHYVLRDRALATVRRGIAPRHEVTLSLGVERTTGLAVRAVPAGGTFADNPPLGAGTVGLARLTIERVGPTLGLRGGVGGRLAVEGGRGDTLQYLRVRGAARAQLPLGRTDVVARAWGGWGSRELPAYRSFALGGRGTLVSAPFRVWGGRYAAWGNAEWRARLPFPALPLGPALSTGKEIVAAPFVRAGWADGPVAGAPWGPSGGIRGEVGLALEWFHRLLRVELAVNRDGDVGLVADVGRELWGIL